MNRCSGSGEGRRSLRGAVALCVLAAPFASGCTGDLFHDTTWADDACPADGSPHDEPCTLEIIPGVFVRNEGSDDAAGTRDAPVQTLARAIELAAASSNRIYACAQTFDEAVALPSGMALFGGLDCDAEWTSVGGDRRTVIAPQAAATESADAIAITLLAGSATTRLEDVEVVAAKPTSGGGSSIAVYADHTHASILRSTLTAAAGAPGVVGEAPATPGEPGKVGEDGGSACIGPSEITAGGEPPQLRCDDGSTTAGGSGGDGDADFMDGADGEDGSPASTGGAGGPGEDELAECGNGQDGADGQPGATGANAGDTDLGVFSSAGFVGAAGQPGAPGKPGQGGGGGGASRGFSCSSGAGAAGGSGGTGGCGGKPGGGGGAGGSSIALASNEAVVSVAGSKLVASSGGPGGNGGQPSDGGAGANGGGGGLGYGPENASAGCNGGQGGRGGFGGAGGGGRGGHSLGIAFAGASPSVAADVAIYVVPESGRAPGGLDGDMVAAALGLATLTLEIPVAAE